jgi:hypothetical protein
MAEALRADERLVLVLDGGGTAFRFNAIRGGRALLEAPRTMPSFGDDLERSLAQITDGFAAIHAETGRQAVALSLAFPGPADYRRGIIGDLPNLARFRGGVPLGQVAGDAIANALTLIDGLVVLGGGLSGAAGLFRAALLDELNGRLDASSGPVERVPCKVLDLDDPAGLAALVAPPQRELAIPGTAATIAYAPQKLTGVGVTRLGTTAAIALGAYAFALGEIAGR